MTLWFEMVPTGALPLYPLRQTHGRGNVQIQLTKLSIMAAKHPDFFIAIHDGGSRAWYIPYSWFKSQIMPFARVRKRPYDPSQRYITVDELVEGKHAFSFGLDKSGDALHVSLGQFFNTVKSPTDIKSKLEKAHPAATGFAPSEAPFILLKDELESLGLPLVSIIAGKPLPLLGRLIAEGFDYKLKGDVLVITHPDQPAKATTALSVFKQLMKVGKASTEHLTTEVARRPYQSAVREAAIAIYQSSCAMCDVDIRPCLTASHIRPASIDKANRANMSNVLLLCSLHDSLFDRFLITVLPNLEVRLNPSWESKSEHLEDWVVRLEGEKVRKPVAFPPAKDLLAWHARRAGVAP